MHRMLKAGFYTVSALFFVAVLFMALELFTRWWIPIEQARVSETMLPSITLARELNQAYIAASPPPVSEISSGIEHPTVDGFVNFVNASQKDRQTLANQDRAWFFVSSPNGQILETYPPKTDDDLQGLSSQAAGVAIGTNATVLLGEAEKADWLALLASSSLEAQPVRRYYETRFADGGAQTLEWLAHRPQQLGDLQIVTRVSPAIWKKFGFRFRPGIYLPNHMENFGTVPFRTNSQGWRDDEMEVPKPPSIYRIVCIGGSTTVGGPRGDLTYPNMLERKLRERFKTDRIEVANCGVYAASSTTARLQINDYMELQPDLVIQYNFINDFLPSHAHAVYGGWLGPLRRALAHSQFIRYFANRFLWPPRDLLVNHYRGSTLENFHATVEAARAIGADVAFGSFGCPSAGEIPESESDYLLLSRAYIWSSLLDTHGYVFATSVFAEALREFCEQEQATYLPVYENVRGGLDTYMDMCHMHLPAMDQMAETIADTIEPLVEKGLAKAAP